MPRLAIVVVATLVAVGGATADAAGRPPETVVLDIGLDQGSLTQVSPTDVQVATRVWVNQLAEEVGLEARTSVTVYDDADELIRDLAAKRVGLASFTAPNFLRARERLDIEPVSVACRDGHCGPCFVLLVARHRKLASLTALAGKNLIVQVGGVTAIASLWLEDLLQSQGLPLTERHFGSVRKVRKTQQAALPVFFDQADACVVDRENFKTLTELNPQLGRVLIPVATSPRFMNEVLCIRRDFTNPKVRRLFFDVVWKLQDTVKGRQILTLFRTEKFLRFDPRDLEAVKALLERLRKRTRGDRGRAAP